MSLHGYDIEPRRRRLWPVFVAPVLVLLLATGWSVFWFMATSRLADEIEAWRVREAQAGRAYTCASQDISGYPFRFELRCAGPSATLTSTAPNMIVGAQSLLAVAQVYDPTLLIVELTSPGRIATAGESGFDAVWTLAQASVRGTPNNPQRVSLVFDGPSLSEAAAAGGRQVLAARRLEVHGRMIGGSGSDRPVIELSSRLEEGTLPLLHQLTMQPFSSEGVVVLKGLRDFAPKPWPQRFREIQQEGGTIEIMQSRFSQGEVLATTIGTLRLTGGGYLSGELEVVVAGIDKLLPALGIDKLLQEGAAQNAQPPAGLNTNPLNNAIGALDRLVPGLGNAARQHINQGLAAGVALIGQPTELEGRKASRIALRLDNGAVFLGPVKLAQTPSLF